MSGSSALKILFPALLGRVYLVSLSLYAAAFVSYMAKSLSSCSCRVSFSWDTEKVSEIEPDKALVP